MYLPTSKEGMNAAVGQYIHSIVAAKIEAEAVEAAARKAAPGYIEEPYCWDKKMVNKRVSAAESLAAVVARVKAKQPETCKPKKKKRGEECQPSLWTANTPTTMP